MSEDEFKNNYTEYSIKAGKFLIVKLAIMNVKVGDEALEVAKAYGMLPSTLMMDYGSSLSGIKHGQDYITFINDGNKSFIVQSGDEPLKTSHREVYYPEVEKSVKELIKSNNINKSIDLYKLFGMEK